MILFPKEKIGVIFFIRKKTIPRGGVRGGVWQKTIKNTVFFRNPSLMHTGGLTWNGDPIAFTFENDSSRNRPRFLHSYCQPRHQPRSDMMGVGWGLHWWSGTMLWFPVCHSWKGPQGFYNNCGSIAAPTVATPIHASKSKHASKVRFPDWLQWRRLREMLCFAVVFGSYGTVWPGVVIMVCYGDDCALVFRFQFKVMSLVPPVVGLVGLAWCTLHSGEVWRRKWFARELGK